MFAELSNRLELKKTPWPGKTDGEQYQGSLKGGQTSSFRGDVNYKVVKDFISKVEEKSIGQGVLRSITPGQQVVKIVYDELTFFWKDSARDEILLFRSHSLDVSRSAGLRQDHCLRQIGKLLSQKGEVSIFNCCRCSETCSSRTFENPWKKLNLSVYSSRESPVKSVNPEWLKPGKKNWIWL